MDMSIKGGLGALDHHHCLRHSAIDHSGARLAGAFVCERRKRGVERGDKEEGEKGREREREGRRERERERKGK